MKKKTKLIFDNAEVLSAFVYLFAQSAAMMYILCRRYAVICTIIMTAVMLGIYMLFYKLRKRKLISFLAFSGLFTFVMLFLNVVGNPYRSPSFLEFIFTSSDFFDVSYAAGAILLFSMIIGFTVCYFTAYLPRPGFLLLTSYIPLILAARTMGGLPLGLLVFLAAGFFAASMGIARPEAADGVAYFDEKHSRKERLLAMGALAAAAAVVLIILPKRETTAYMTYFDNLLRGRTSYYGRRALSNFMDNSIPNTGNNNPSPDTLFLVSASMPQNVSRWSFDIYQGEDGWTYDGDFSEGYSGWESDRRSLNLRSLVRQLKTAVRDGKLARFSEEISALDDSTSTLTQMTVRVTDGSSTSVVMHPLNTVNARITTGQSMTTYRNDKDEIFTSANMPANSSYVLEYFVELPNRSLAELSEKVGFQTLLEEAYREDAIDSELYYAFTEENTLAKEYFHATDDGSIPEEIYYLAHEITRGLDSDYEKAQAIERWFGEADFIYDMDFVPQSAAAEYFLFDSRRGICTDYATATTLLLRAVGIPARYTEGFVLKEDNRDTGGRYVVTAEQAHAYSTAYIEGMGWIEVDGTKYARRDTADETLRNSMMWIASIAAVLLVLGLIFRRQLSEAVFAVIFRFSGKTARIRLVYLRTRRLACGIADTEPNSATAEEVRDIIARTLDLDKEAGEITDAANELLYGGGAPDADELRLYQNYKAIYKMKRSRGK